MYAGNSIVSIAVWTSKPHVVMTIRTHLRRGTCCEVVGVRRFEMDGIGSFLSKK